MRTVEDIVKEIDYCEQLVVDAREFLREHGSTLTPLSIQEQWESIVSMEARVAALKWVLQ